MAFPEERLRRLRRTPALRRLARETRLSPADLVHPLFVREGIPVPADLVSLPGHRQETVASAGATAEEAVTLGIGAVVLFGVPARKDPLGSEAWNDSGIVQTSLRALRQRLGDACVLIADCCLDEYTDHGHCGVLREDGSVDNDRTIELYARAAVSQAAAGADVIAPSGMMDGQVAAIRAALDEAGFPETAILAYTAKYATVMYGPFREAADCAPKSGDRRGYQMDVGNSREAVREARLDAAEGADMLMVKPALTCLDVIARVRAATELPLFAYNVSGEYAMIHHAARAGAFDERAAALEALTAIRRAGADTVISYHALQAARWLREE
ncbi:MAG TPA: porphobilinogen synthase [Candidatus Binatia bacterium]|nr:porphobilinogen synthase [Candidatus Binatia bacterium]